MTIPAIGDPRDRVDGRAKVTGTARYAAENNVDGIVHAVLVMATIPSGTIRSIDTADAKKVPGVIAILTYQNAPKLTPLATNPAAGQAQHQGNGQQQKASGGMSLPSVNPAEPHLMPLSGPEIHYLGQHVAVVVADTLEHATHAAELVRVHYADKPAKIVLANHRNEAKDRAQGGLDNKFAKGDADAAFASAAVKVDYVYRTPYEHHNPLEAHSLVAAWSGDQLTLHDSSQNIFAVRQTIAKAFGIPKENIRVMSPFVGGAFGSKGSSWPHVLIGVMAARVVKRPVKLVVTRKQLFFANGHRPETEQRVALGSNADGKLVALIHDGVCQTNSVCDYTERFTRPSRVIYDVPNMRVAHRAVELNLSSPTFMRAPGESPGMFAIESAMDELAVALKVDPIELRLRNYADVDPSNGKPWSSKSLKECYQQAAERIGWSKRTPEPRSMKDGRLLVGIGMASAVYPSHRAPTSAKAVMRAAGSVTVSCGSHEMGMGTATVMSQLAAETLGIPPERVRFEYGDTTLPQAPISAGSMTAASVGTAVYQVSSDLKQKIVAMGNPGEEYTAILARHYLPSVETSIISKPDPSEETHSAQAFGAQFAEVVVDPELGTVRVRRIVGAFGGGRILNAKTARSQFIGGIVQGIGMALLEQTHLDPRIGSYTNVNFGEYLVPVNPDVPSIDVIMVEEKDEYVNPIGAKGIGEIGIVGVAPAIANAVFHATGKRVRDLPITIAKLL